MNASESVQSIDNLYAAGSENSRPTPAPSLLVSLVFHYHELVDYVQRRFRQRAFAREVVHEVCIRLLERPEPPSPRQPLALLYRLSHDAAVDRCRADDARSQWVDTVAELPESACPAPTQARVLAAQAELEHLAAAVDAMPRRRRQVFVLHKIHEIPQTEVARRMGICLKAVEKHLRLAMAECRSRLEEH